MTDAELIIQASEAISSLILANPEYTREQLMFQAYMGGLAEGGKIVSAHIEAFAASKKAAIKDQFGSETMKAIRGK